MVVKGKDLELTFKEIYEQNQTLRVVVEHSYGEDNIGLAVEKKKLDPATGRPKYEKEVKRLLEGKYGRVLEDESTSHGRKKPVDSDLIGKTVKLSALEPDNTLQADNSEDMDQVIEELDRLDKDKADSKGESDKPKKGGKPKGKVKTPKKPSIWSRIKSWFLRKIY